MYSGGWGLDFVLCERFLFDMRPSYTSDADNASFSILSVAAIECLLNYSCYYAIRYRARVSIAIITSAPSGRYHYHGRMHPGLESWNLIWTNLVGNFATTRETKLLMHAQFVSVWIDDNQGISSMWHMHRTYGLPAWRLDHFWARLIMQREILRLTSNCHFQSRQEMKAWECLLWIAFHVQKKLGKWWRPLGEGHCEGDDYSILCSTIYKPLCECVPALGVEVCVPHVWHARGKVLQIWKM